MKKIFISQIMRGLSQEEIVEARSFIQSEFTELLGDGFMFIESYKPELEHAGPVEALAASLTMLADADIVLVPRNSLSAIKTKTANQMFNDKTLRGTEFEMFIAKSYGKTIIFYSIREKKDSVYFEFKSE